MTNGVREEPAAARCRVTEATGDSPWRVRDVGADTPQTFVGAALFALNESAKNADCFAVATETANTHRSTPTAGVRTRPTYRRPLPVVVRQR
jgi:hypothetical protein